MLEIGVGMESMFKNIYYKEKLEFYVNFGFWPRIFALSGQFYQTSIKFG